MDNVVETLETLMAWKKKTQCMDIINPQNNNIKSIFFETNIFFPNKNDKINRQTEAINILYQTSFTAPIEISEPKIAVNPKIKTIKWK